MIDLIILKNRQILELCLRAKKICLNGTWRVMVIPIIVGTLGRVSKGFEKRLEELKIK